MSSKRMSLSGSCLASCLSFSLSFSLSFFPSLLLSLSLSLFFSLASPKISSDPVGQKNFSPTLPSPPNHLNTSPLTSSSSIFTSSSSLSFVSFPNLTIFSLHVSSFSPLLPPLPLSPPPNSPGCFFSFFSSPLFFSPRERAEETEPEERKSSTVSSWLNTEREGARENEGEGEGGGGEKEGEVWAAYQVCQPSKGDEGEGEEGGERERSPI